MSTTFTIKAPSGTDIWRKPPTTDVFTAPRVPPPSTTAPSSRRPLSTFRSARLSFHFTPTVRYDQAGLLLSLTAHGGGGGEATHGNNNPSSSPPPKWIKTGIEYYNDVPRAATVACDAWADWSLAPVVVVSGARGRSNDADAHPQEQEQWTTVLVENSEDELGKSLWVYQVTGDGAKVPLREICWPFGGSPGAEDWDVTVEAYAARPAEGKGELVAEFRDFEVTWT